MKGIALCLSLLFASSAWATSAEESLCGRPSVPVVRMEKQEKFCRSFSRAMAALPEAMAADTRALLSPENIAVMGLLTATWLGSQGVPVVGQAVDAALFTLGVALLMGQAVDLTHLLWTYVNHSTAARSMAELDEAATYLARAVSMVGVNVVAFILMKKALAKLPRGPSSPSGEYAFAQNERMPEASVRQASPAATAAPAVWMVGSSGREPKGAARSSRSTKKTDSAAFDEWIRQAQKKPSIEKPEEAAAFQRRYAGPEEILVEGSGEQVWADGARASDAHLVDTKYVGNPESSPFVDNSSCPDSVREIVRKQEMGQLRRYAAIILDPTTPAVGLEIITNDGRAAPYFERLMKEVGVPGEVVVRK